MGYDDGGEAVRDAFVAVRLDIYAHSFESIGVSEAVITEGIDTCALYHYIDVNKRRRPVSPGDR